MLNSLVALVVPFAAVTLLAVQHDRYEPALVWTLLALSASSALLGVFQIAGLPGNPLYPYRITSSSDPVGLFSNRNHHAFFLTASLPLAAWLCARRAAAKEACLGA